MNLRNKRENKRNSQLNDECWEITSNNFVDLKHDKFEKQEKFWQQETN